MSTSAQPPTGRKRLVHQLDTPFSTTSWPDVSPDDQDAILELLCSFLSPLGHHRRAHTTPSKGKRARRRASKAPAEAPDSTAPPSNLPPGPDMRSHVDVGFNSISRELQAPAEPGQPRYSAVFTVRGSQPSAFHCHFPHMVAAASRNSPAPDAIRLVGFSKPCSDRIARALGVPRVSSVAVRQGAPGAHALLAFVEQKVAPVRVPWMEGDVADYQPVKILSTETTVGAKRARHG